MWERSPFSKVPERCEQKNRSLKSGVEHLMGFFFFNLQMQGRQFKGDLCCRLKKSLLERKKTVLISVQLARGLKENKGCKAC